MRIERFWPDPAHQPREPSFKGDTHKMRIERRIALFPPSPANQFQRRYSQNEDWKNWELMGLPLSGAVSKAILTKWGLKALFPVSRRAGMSFQRRYSQNEDWKSSFFRDISVGGKFQRRYSQNEDWKSQQIQSLHFLLGFKGDTHKMRIERDKYIPCTLTICVSKAILTKWGLKGTTNSLWQQNAENVSKAILTKWGLKVFLNSFVLHLIPVSKAILTKWGLKGLNRPWFHFSFFVSKAILTKWGLKDIHTP